MHLFKVVSGTLPVGSLPAEQSARFPPAFIGDIERLRKEFPRERFPQLIGIGHLMESPPGLEPITHYLTLLEKTERGWVPARIDPR